MIILKNAAVSPYLKPCTVTIHTGEKVALLGASGAGKTTLMRLMCGWLTPTSGDVIAPPVGEFAYVPQDLDASLNPAMRVVTLSPSRSLSPTVMWLPRWHESRNYCARSICRRMLPADSLGNYRVGSGNVSV